MQGIYLIENKVNGKVYVGQTHDFKSRWNGHLKGLLNNNHGNKHLQSAWNKFGKQNFYFSILEICSSNLLDEREVYWISFYKSSNTLYGYNKTIGGGGAKGYKHTEEAKRKISKPGNKHPLYGKKHTLDAIERMRKIKTGKKLSEETRLKIGESERGEKHHYYGKKRDVKTNEKISKKLYGRKLPKETRLKMSQSKKGLSKSYEHRKNLSISKSVLTDNNVIEILKRIANKETLKSIALDYDVTPPTIGNIKRNKTYTHINRSEIK